MAWVSRAGAGALIAFGCALAVTTASAAPPKKAGGAVPASRIWHTAPPGKTAPVDANGRPKLVLQGLNIPDHVELAAATDRGGFAAEDLERAAHVMREPSSGNEHPIDPRLIDTIYRLQVHFKAPEIRIISGPTPDAWRSASLIC